MFHLKAVPAQEYEYKAAFPPGFKEIDYKQPGFPALDFHTIQFE